MGKGENNPGFPYTRAALICGLLASLAFALSMPDINLIGKLFGRDVLYGGLAVWLIEILAQVMLYALPGLFLMLPGALVRRPQWLILLSFIGIILVFPLLLVAIEGSTSPAWPKFYDWEFYIMAVGVSLYYGVYVVSNIKERWLIKLFSPAVAVFALILLTRVLIWIFPYDYGIYQRWEFATIIIGGPLLCVLTYLPFDLINRKKPVGSAEPPPLPRQQVQDR